VTGAEVEEMVSLYDIDGKGSLCFEDFMAMMAKIIQPDGSFSTAGRNSIKAKRRRAIIIRWPENCLIRDTLFKVGRKLAASQQRMTSSAQQRMAGSQHNYALLKSNNSL
jgi:hypothetical protein